MDVSKCSLERALVVCVHSKNSAEHFTHMFKSSVLFQASSPDWFTRRKSSDRGITGF